MERVRYRKPNNERQDPSAIKLFVCYHCGDHFPLMSSYHHHLIYSHQVVALCYQIYHSELTAEKEAKKKELKGEKKERPSETTPESLGSRRYTLPETIAEKEKVVVTNVIEEARRISESNRAAVEEEKLRIMNERKERKRAMDRLRRQKKKAESIALKNNDEPQAKRFKPEDLHLKEIQAAWESPSSSIPETRPLDTFQYTIEALSSECPICAEFDFSEKSLLRHCIDAHGVNITNVQVEVRSGQDLLKVKDSPSGKECVLCNMEITSKTRYFEHLLETHVRHLLQNMKTKYVTMNNAVINAAITYSPRPEAQYMIRLLARIL